MFVLKNISGNHDTRVRKLSEGKKYSKVDHFVSHGIRVSISRRQILIPKNISFIRHSVTEKYVYIKTFSHQIINSVNIWKQAS